MAAFAITTPTPSLKGRNGQLSYTVTNMTQQNLRERAYVVVEANASGSWFTVVDPERDCVVGCTEHFTVQVAVPRSVAAGSYRLRLDVAGVQIPDELSAEGPWATVEVPAVGHTRSLPWLWILIAIGSVALLATAVVLFLALRQPGKVSPPPNVTPPPLAELSVSLTLQDFGEVEVGSGKISTVTVDNIGAGRTSVTAAFAGGDGQDFQIQGNSCSGMPLATKGHCQFQVVFAPKSQGVKHVTLSLQPDNAHALPDRMLTGTGRPASSIAFKPASITINLGSGPNPPTAGTAGVEVENVGREAVTLQSSQILSDNRAPWSITYSCVGTLVLQPGESCHIQIDFRFNGIGQATAELLVVDDELGNREHRMSIVGTRGR